MKIDIAELKLEAGRHAVVSVQIAMDPTELSGQPVVFDRPFTGNAEIWNAGDRFLVRASVSGEATVQCSRCLQAMNVPLTTSFEEEFVEGSPGSELDMHEDDDRTVTYFQGDEIDLSDPLREHVLLELPMKPLCSEQCQGLCPTCGANHNLGPCDCTEAKPVDPRLAILQDLLRKPDSNP